MALVDARYRFIMVDVGANGRACDAGIFARSTMSTALEQKKFTFHRLALYPGVSTLCHLLLLAMMPLA